MPQTYMNGITNIEEYMHIQYTLQYMLSLQVLEHPAPTGSEISTHEINQRNKGMSGWVPDVRLSGYARHEP